LSDGFQSTFVYGIVTKPQHTEPMFQSEALVRRVKMRTQWYCFKTTLCQPYSVRKVGNFLELC